MAGKMCRPARKAPHCRMSFSTGPPARVCRPGGARMRWIQRGGRALAGGLLLTAAALPALAVPQPPSPAAPQAAPAPPPAAPTEATARRIPAAEAREALAKGRPCWSTSAPNRITTRAMPREPSRFRSTRSTRAPASSPRTSWSSPTAPEEPSIRAPVRCSCCSRRASPRSRASSEGWTAGPRPEESSPTHTPSGVRPKSGPLSGGLSDSLRSPFGGGGRDVTGRNENLSEATGTASRLRRRAGRRQRQSMTEAGFEASCEGGPPEKRFLRRGRSGDLPCEET